MIQQILLLATAAVVGAQNADSLEPEVHPKLSWKRCTAPGTCESVQGEIVIDAEWRWIHEVGGYENCYSYSEWTEEFCPDDDTCTENCALDGASYKSVYGLETKGDRLTQPYKTYFDFSSNTASRVFLLENEDTYQTFTLMDNELAFDIDLSTVVCGVNSALRFIEMDPDGGMAKYPTNKAGAKYGTGYCDSGCTRRNRYVGGKANVEGWVPNEEYTLPGYGDDGACCSEFDVWNSNSHSYSMSSRVCAIEGYGTCGTPYCDETPEGDRHYPCDPIGCDYSPFRLGATDFYGPGKTLDSSKNFTVVTRFAESGVTQFFIQDGKKIDPPPPQYPSFPETAGLSEEYCDVLFYNLDERDRFVEAGGWPVHTGLLRRPLVLALSISADLDYHNLWLDSVFPADRPDDQPGALRGDCNPADNDPSALEYLAQDSEAIWSNIRFGPIGSTVDI